MSCAGAAQVFGVTDSIKAYLLLIVERLLVIELDKLITSYYLSTLLTYFIILTILTRSRYRFI